MKMNIYQKTMISAAIIAVATISFSELSAPAHGNAGGAPAARTGSPGDGANCSACHLCTPSTVTGLITSNIPASGYIPGATYTVTATVSVMGINKYGFEISPQSATGVKKGTLIVTSPTETQLISTGKYITHKSTGTAGTGTRTWSFNWTAPAAGSGDFNFYGAFVAANGNGANTGDQVRMSTLFVQENLSAGIVENSVHADSWTVYPNPAKDQFSLRSEGNEKVNRILISDITGKLIKTIETGELSQNESIDIADLQNGMYVLSITTDKGTITRKIIKN